MTLCTVLSKVDQASSVKHIITLVLGRRLYGKYQPRHLQHVVRTSTIIISMKYTCTIYNKAPFRSEYNKMKLQLHPSRPSSLSLD